MTSRREAEDDKIEQVGQIVDALARVMPYRRLMNELANPDDEIVEMYRSLMLEVHAGIRRIAFEASGGIVK